MFIICFAGPTSARRAANPDSGSPRSRSRSPLRGNSHTRQQQQPSPDENNVYANTSSSQHSPSSSKEDSYSASLRLASLESLTGRGQFLGRPASPASPPHREAADLAAEAARFSHVPPLPTSSAASSIKVPTSNDDGNAAMALANFGLLGLPLGHLLGGGPAGPSLAHLLGGQAGVHGGLPRPADLIQQAQALQLLAHLQTVLMQAGGPGQPGGPGYPAGTGHPGGPGLPSGHHPYQSSAAGQQRHSPNLFSPDMQKVS
jgi:hypothetical protein